MEASKIVPLKTWSSLEVNDDSYSKEINRDQ
jgi:hypothetical protein